MNFTLSTLYTLARKIDPSRIASSIMIKWTTPAISIWPKRPYTSFLNDAYKFDDVEFSSHDHTYLSKSSKSEGEIPPAEYLIS